MEYSVSLFYSLLDFSSLHEHLLKLFVYTRVVFFSHQIISTMVDAVISLAYYDNFLLKLYIAPLYYFL